MIPVALFCLLLLSGCALTSSHQSEPLVSVQILDRNGFSETFNGKDRLKNLEKTDFTAPQPYQKITRVYGRSSRGKTFCKINTYHTNGFPKQYLEVKNGRAHGKFLEWHENGTLKIDATVIEGTPDFSEMAQMSWVFDQISLVYDEESHLIASIPYEKGFLEGTSSYFYPDGKLYKEIPYRKDQIEGIVRVFDQEGTLVEQISYLQGEREGKAWSCWRPGKFKYVEEYQKGALMLAHYFDPQGIIIAEIKEGKGERVLFEGEHLKTLIEYHDGVIQGKVRHFNPQGKLLSFFHLKEGLKDGKEWEYYPSQEETPQPKLYIEWHQDKIQGLVKTWYPNGLLESQREMHDNQKQGVSLAWSKTEELLLFEEYDKDRLVKGLYFKKGETQPTSKVENGKGTATLFNEEGQFSQQILYEKGMPKPSP